MLPTIGLMLLFFCLIGGFFVASGIGIAFLLRMLVSSLEMGSAMVAGSVLGVATVFFFIRCVVYVNRRMQEEEEEQASPGKPGKETVYVFGGDLFRSGSKRRKKPKK
jgi:membrane protein implicated in regulation of membrane protease activity